MSTNAWRIVCIICLTIEATWLAAAGVWLFVPIACAGIAVFPPRGLVPQHETEGA